MTDEEIIEEILKREGGFVDHPNDPGGATNFGITRKVLKKWRGRSTSIEDVRGLTIMEAKMIYFARYIRRPGFDAIRTPDLKLLVIDCGVNHGTFRAVKWLQKAVGVKPDGKIGPISRRAIGRADAALTYRKVIATRVRFYGEIIRRRARLHVFAAGWMNRAAGFVEKTP